MKNTSKVLWPVAGFLSFSLVLSGCGNGGDAGSNATDNRGAAGGDDLSTVTIGYNPTIVQPQPLIGLGEGEYDKRVAGVKFDGKSFDAGPAVLRALRANVVQIACSGAWPAIKAFAKDGDVVLLSGAATGGTQLMVKKDSPIKTVKDLKGKVIGVNQTGSTVEAMVRYQVLKAGLSPDNDVKFVEIKPAEQADALSRDQVAAVAAPAPWPSTVQIKGNARPLLDWKQIYQNGNYLAGSIYTNKKFAATHPDFIKKFVAANAQITDELNKDRTKGDARVLAAWSKATGKTLKPDIAKAAFSTIRYTVATDEASLQKFADINFELGILKKKADLKGFVWKSN